MRRPKDGVGAICSVDAFACPTEKLVLLRNRADPSKGLDLVSQSIRAMIFFKDLSDSSV